MSAVIRESVGSSRAAAAAGQVTLGHGAGGTLTAALVAEHFLPAFHGHALRALGDGALVSAGRTPVVLSTDTFVVHPLEFPGGTIGTLAVNGTVNDLAMMGAIPCYLTAGFVLEEGLPFDVLDRMVASMADAARVAGVQIVAGDTKVVARGKGDGIFINTTGLGLTNSEFHPRPNGARPGDVVLVSGDIGVHGLTMLAAREGLRLAADVASDTVCLYPLVDALRRATDDQVAALRDPTRAGLAGALNEIAVASGVGIEVDEAALPLPAAVTSACAMLGLDPLYLANEGIFVAFVPPLAADQALSAMRDHPLGRQAKRVGRVVDEHRGIVVLRATAGISRIIDLPAGDQLPRTC